MVRIHPDPPVECHRGCSSVGRAPALQAGGHRFDPVQLHQTASRPLGAGLRNFTRVRKQAATLTSDLWIRVRLFFNKTEEVKRTRSHSEIVCWVRLYRPVLSRVRRGWVSQTPVMRASVVLSVMGSSD